MLGINVKLVISNQSTFELFELSSSQGEKHPSSYYSKGSLKDNIKDMLSLNSWIDLLLPTTQKDRNNDLASLLIPTDPKLIS